MPDKIELEIVTPEGATFREAVDEVEAPGKEGYFGVLPGHTPFLTQLKAGTVRYRVGTKEGLVSVTWGFAEVLPYQVTLLVNNAERAEDIDLQRAESSRERADARLEEFGVVYDVDKIREAREASERAQARLETARRAKEEKH